MSELVIPEFENDEEQFLEQDDASSDVLSESVEEVRVSDERANVPVSETTERFLRAILAKVPLDRIEELHLFSPLRQGTAETGIAVIAARVLMPVEPAGEELEMQLEAGPDVEVDEESGEEFEEDVEAIVDAEVDVEVDAQVDATVDSTVDSEVDSTVDSEVNAEVNAQVDARESLVANNDDSPYADDPLPVAPEDMLDFAHELGPDVADEDSDDIPQPPRVRHTVYTARYRLVIKGPDRGKWEMDVVDEADAPLLAVESVVRGVQRRAGEETATVRYDAGQIARALRLNPPSIS